MHPQLVFVFQLEAGADKNTLELNNKVLLRETKLNHVNTKSTRSIFVCKKDKYTASFFFDNHILKSSLLKCYLFVRSSFLKLKISMKFEFLS